VTALIVATGAIVIIQETIFHSSSNQQTNPSPTPTPAVEQFVVTTVTASPSNATPGLVTIVAEVRNDGKQNETVLVIMQIKEPNGTIMSIANNSSPLNIPTGESKTATFEPVIPLNVKIGQFNVDIDVYDMQRGTKYYSTGFIYTFTTPIEFQIGFNGYLVDGDYYMTIDGATYQFPRIGSRVFYWYLGTKHTITVSNIIMNVIDPGSNVGSQFSDWSGSPYDIKGTTLQLTVIANGTTHIVAIYGPYFK
jgi:hypothetical protein